MKLQRLQTRRRKLHSVSPLGGVILVSLLLAGCCTRQGPKPIESVKSFTILAINDVYRIEGVDEGTEGGLARLRTLRRELQETHPDLLLLHAGDFLFPSLLSRQYRGKQMIDVLNHLDGDGEAMDQRMFVTFGNHEFDRGKMQDAPLLDKRIRGSQFHWLGTDITFAEGEDGQPLVAEDNLLRQTIVDAGGIRVGLFSLTTQGDAPEYISQFSDPEETARRVSASLRQQGAEVVVALTHLTIIQDEALLRALGDEGPDLIMGGHEHNQQNRQVGRRWVIKADAEARTASVVNVFLEHDGTPKIAFSYVELGPETPADAAVNTLVEGWIERHDREYCTEELEKPPGCLADVFGSSRNRLIGEELEIRRYETNLGNWLVDQARLALARQGAQIAIFNSGSFRLNQNLPSGAITRRNLEEIFQYSAKLQLLRVSGAQLQTILSHSVSDWTGNGHWLQVSGLAFRHDPKQGVADRLTYLDPEGSRSIQPEDTFLLVIGDYIGGGGDGYTLFEGMEKIPYGEVVDLKDVAAQALAAAGDAGIAPEVEGRICNTERPGPCLALP